MKGCLCRHTSCSEYIRLSVCVASTVSVRMCKLLCICLSVCVYSAVSVQVHKLEASLRGQKEAVEVEVRGTAGQADSLREQVGQLRNQASHALAASEDKLRSLHTQYDDLVR